MMAGVAAGVWTVRRLGVPLWWVAFPPLFHAIWNGNPETLVLALLVLNHPLASAGALALKLYVGVQLLFRPRAAHHRRPHRRRRDADPAVAGVPCRGCRRAPRRTWNGSAFRIPLLLIPTVLALVVLCRKGGEWWWIPACGRRPSLLRCDGHAGGHGRKVLAGLVALPLRCSCR